MKDFITKLLPHLLTALKALVAGLIAWLVTKFGLDVGPDTRAEITSTVTLFIFGILQTWGRNKGIIGVAAIQDQIPWVKTTGSARVNGTTVAAVKQLVEEAKNPPPIIIGEKPPETVAQAFKK